MGKEKTTNKKFVEDYKKGYKKANRPNVLTFTFYIIVVAIVVIISLFLYRSGISR